MIHGASGRLRGREPEGRSVVAGGYAGIEPLCPRMAPQVPRCCSPLQALVPVRVPRLTSEGCGMDAT